MDKQGIGSKTVYYSTQEGVQTQIRIRYNPRTDLITFLAATFTKPCGNGGSRTDNQCSTFLGIHVAERVLSKIFQNVTRMRNGNPGYDFTCAKGYRIDVKSATKMKLQNSWEFKIKKNRIAVYFLLLAFDNRDNLNPQHLWLVQGGILSEKKSASISPSTLEKWSKYELDSKLSDVITCCNILKGEL